MVGWAACQQQLQVLECLLSRLLAGANCQHLQSLLPSQQRLQKGQQEQVLQPLEQQQHLGQLRQPPCQLAATLRHPSHQP